LESVWREIVAQHRALKRALEELLTLFSQDRESFYLYMKVVVDFLKRVHTPLEDELVFPKLEETCRGASSKQVSIANTLSRLSADHKLLLTLGNTITARGKSFDDSTLRERLEQFANILLEHNANEEELYQTMVKVCGEERGDTALRIPAEVQKVIEAYGVERYNELCVKPTNRLGFRKTG